MSNKKKETSSPIPDSSGPTIRKTDQEIINKYKNLSFLDFEKMINNVNGNQLDDDLKFIVDAILELHFSIKYCEQIENDTIRSSGFKDSYRHQLKIISYYTTILKDFRWFQELKKMNKHFNYLEEKKTLIEKINQSTV